jgi:hypothetical protein
MHGRAVQVYNNMQPSAVKRFGCSLTEDEWESVRLEIVAHQSTPETIAFLNRVDRQRRTVQVETKDAADRGTIQRLNDMMRKNPDFRYEGVDAQQQTYWLRPAIVDIDDQYKHLKSLVGQSVDEECVNSLKSLHGSKHLYTILWLLHGCPVHTLPNSDAATIARREVPLVIQERPPPPYRILLGRLLQRAANQIAHRLLQAYPSTAGVSCQHADWDKGPYDPINLALLDECDCLLTWYTIHEGDQALELAMAVAKYRPILILKSQQDRVDGRRLPDHQTVEYHPEDFDLTKHNLDEAIAELRKRVSPNAQQLWSQVKDAILQASPDRWTDYQKGIVTDLTAQVSKEIIDVGREEYEIDIDHGFSYLRRARPLFDKDKWKNDPSVRISVVSVVETVSSFWLDNPELSEPYRDNQPAHTIRLFVFRKPETLVRYTEELAKHYVVYGEKGAVLVCSYDEYAKFLTRLKGDNILFPRPDQDFALIARGGSGQEVIRVELDRRTFGFRRVTGHEMQVCTEIQDQFKKLRDDPSLQGGHTNADREEYDRRLLCGRWYPHLGETQNRKFLTTFIDELFKDREGSAYHMVFLSNAERIENLSNLKDVLRKLWHGERMKVFRETCGLIDVWFGTKMRTYERDEVRQLCTERPELNPAVIIMKFESKTGLEHFLTHAEHLRIRKDFYKALGSDVSWLLDTRIADGTVADFLYSASQREGASTSELEQMRTQARSALEKLAATYFTRRDYVDSLTAGDVVPIGE